MPTKICMGWEQELGLQIRAARKGVGLTQTQLAEAVGKSRQMVSRYETGSDVPPLDVMAKIALRLGIGDINVNGYRLSLGSDGGRKESEPSEQLLLQFGKEYVYPGATIKITPTKVNITITAIGPSRRA